VFTRTAVRFVIAIIVLLPVGLGSLPARPAIDRTLRIGVVWLSVNVLTATAGIHVGSPALAALILGLDPVTVASSRCASMTSARRVRRGWRRWLGSPGS
jgi:drug/metabolite transporter (DMT)-like permease